MAKGKYHEWITPEGLLKIEGWARDGLTDEQIAHNMGISTRTIYEWKNAYPQILHALKNGKEVVDRQVENALLKRALGYTFEEVTKELAPIGRDEQGKPIYGLQVSKVVKKEVVADTTAGIFWLKNRKPSEWRDRVQVEQEVKHSHEYHIVQEIVERKPEELNRVRNLFREINTVGVPDDSGDLEG